MTGEWARTSADSKLVYLHDNGSWQFVEEKDRATLTASDPGPERTTLETSIATEARAPIDRSTESDFRASHWGDSKDTICAVEGASPDHESDDQIAWSAQLAGLDVFAFYDLHENRLVSASYFLGEEYANENSYVRDFEMLAALLERKYGEPTESHAVWHDDLYEDDGPDKWGRAIASEGLSLIKRWELERTNITAMAYGKDYEVKVAIRYESKELIRVKESAAEAQAIADL
ncbi:hypothetical protein [Demequina muriae]|uniref:Uncharacterized protein n=1 Tax=Demequina muriae TaxID=3051664 RepID=A0ABT8GE53_9MICO|nr:hypothetical protein [Demequina sp. EGI L300058]MDN4479707.1 hypothetical protein [Demequina sp. EGI L300058]